jgi:hypothetical protein
VKDSRNDLKASAGSDDMKRLLREAFERSYASGELKEVLDSVLHDEHLRCDALRIKLKTSLERSCDSGALGVAAQSVRPQQAASSSCPDAVRHALRRRLEQSCESGELFQVLESNLRHATPPPTPLNQSSEQRQNLMQEEKAKEEFRLMLKGSLQKACSSGALEKALASTIIRTNGELRPPVGVEDMRQQLRHTLQQSCDSGELVKALDSATVASQCKLSAVAGEDLRLSVRETLEAALHSGQLHAAVDEVRALSPMANEAGKELRPKSMVTEDIRQVLKDTLQFSCNSGELSKALAEIKGTKAQDDRRADRTYQNGHAVSVEASQSRQTTEAQDAREAIKSTLQNACISGELKNVLAIVRSGKSQQGLDGLGEAQDLRSAIRDLLERSHESGQLAAALGVSKAQQEPEVQGSEDLRIAVKDLLERSHETGKLAEVLRSSKNVPESAKVAPAAVEDLRLSLKGALERSYDSGKLAKSLEHMRNKQITDGTRKIIKDGLVRLSGKGELSQIVTEVAQQHAAESLKPVIRNALDASLAFPDVEGGEVQIEEARSKIKTALLTSFDSGELVNILQASIMENASHVNEIGLQQLHGEEASETRTRLRESLEKSWQTGDLTSILQESRQVSKNGNSTISQVFSRQESWQESYHILQESRQGSKKNNLTIPRVCSCGNTFMPDSIFCRKCGKHRDSEEDRSISKEAIVNAKQAVVAALLPDEEPATIDPKTDEWTNKRCGKSIAGLDVAWRSAQEINGLQSIDRTQKASNEDAARVTVRAIFEKAYNSGVLLQALEKVAAPRTDRAEKDDGDDVVKSRMRDLFAQASQNGELEQAFSVLRQG